MPRYSQQTAPGELFPAPYNQPAADGSVTFNLKFGGGLNSRTLPEDIDPSECADLSQNFGLDIENVAFFRRAPFDLVGTAPNGGSINGFAQLQNANGSTSTIIQSGPNVYSWDGTLNGFTQVGTVDGGAQLRGHYNQNFPVLGYVIITDLQLRQPVMTWNGTTFAPLSTNLGTAFTAKYCHVNLERAWFANVIAGTALPHMIVVSKTSDPTILSTVNKPSSALGPDDPFFLLTPNLSPINATVDAFFAFIISTLQGDAYQTTGSDSTNIAISQIYSQMGALGAESVVYIGNDVAYGRSGKIETLYGVLNYGDVETAELSRLIANKIQNVNNWTLVYDRRLYKLYCFDGNGNVWLYNKSLTEDATRRYYNRKPVLVSPWTWYTTNHPINFNPACAWTMRRPSDGVWCVYMGDMSGNIYQFEGNGGLDGGTTQTVTTRYSKLLTVPDATGYDITGFVDYRQYFPANLTVTLALQGQQVGNGTPITVPLVGVGASVWGSGSYWGQTNPAQPGPYYWGTRFGGYLQRQPLQVAGNSSHWQFILTVTGATDFFIDDIFIKFTPSTGQAGSGS